MATRLDLPPPPTIADSSGGGSGWVELVTARNDIDAHLLAGRLGESGIETRWIKDRLSLPGAWLYGGSNPWAPVVIFVRRIQLEDARLVLAEISFHAPSAEPQPEVAVRKRLPMVWWVTALGLGILLSSIALLQVAESLPACRAIPFCSEAEARP